MTSMDGFHPRVLVTGVGAIIGQGIIRGLRKCPYPVTVIGLDRNMRQPGPDWCDEFIQKPRCEEDSPQYLAFWHSLVRDRRIDLVLPGLDVDVDFLDRHRQIPEGSPCRFALNRSELIAISNDKWRTHEFLAERGVHTIPTTTGACWDEALSLLGAPPILFKPRRGSGSRGIVRLQDAADLAYWWRKAAEPWILQRIVGSDDEEYTVGTFGLGNGDALEPIIFRRRLSPNGHTVEATVVEHEALKSRAAFFNSIFKPLGPTNYQFRVEGREAYLLEVNPRFSSSNSLRTQFGYNESAMAVDFYLLGLRPEAPTIRRGTGWRYSEDYVVYDGNPV